jgi:hypothetical protein
VLVEHGKGDVGQQRGQDSSLRRADAWLFVSS